MHVRTRNGLNIFIDGRGTEYTCPLPMEAAIDDLEAVIRKDGDNETEFNQLLSAKANAFASWSTQRDQLAADPRYLSLSSDAHRKEVFFQWRASQETSISSEQEFVRFIKSKYKQGMIYPVFRRKVAHLPDFTECKLPEKTKESLFRQYITYKKLKGEDLKKFIKQYPAFS